jgi:hypothetical protein
MSRLNAGAPHCRMRALRLSIVASDGAPRPRSTAVPQRILALSFLALEHRGQLAVPPACFHFFIV